MDLAALAEPGLVARVDNGVGAEVREALAVAVLARECSSGRLSSSRQIWTMTGPSRMKSLRPWGRSGLPNGTKPKRGNWTRNNSGQDSMRAWGKAALGDEEEDLAG